ncbi:hypothetical protein AGMMS50256_30670 [Betaproteobacteria bacterium]|nr:hypothetical protein AGMMS50256_30670 [Betaproteobacteria bacterium]
MAQQIQHALSILRRKQVEARIGLSRTSIYEKINPKHERYDPDFPKPIPLGVRAVGFLEGEIDDWLNTQIQKRRKA